MKLVKHNTAEEIIADFWHFDENDLTIEDFIQSDGGGFTSDGTEVKFTGAEELQSIKDNGFWGFCDPKTKVVSVWIGENADPEEIIYFLGHEIGHASGKPIEGDDPRSCANEENRADEYGEVARQAYKWLKELIPSV